MKLQNNELSKRARKKNAERRREGDNGNRYLLFALDVFLCLPFIHFFRVFNLSDLLNFFYYFL